MAGRNRPDRKTVPIAERGHVPFAVIAVLLLVSSVATIAVLETRSEPRIDRDAQLLMERTETAAQAELRTAVLDATHRAGGAPINTTAGSEVDAISDASTQPEAFRAYVKLLIYLEAVERLPAANQSVGPAAQSSVSLEPVTSDASPDGIDPDEAIDQVELDIGYYDDDVEDGTVNATIHGVEFDGTVDGEELPHETRSISVSVGTPVFELNDKMNEYESQLDEGFFEDDGLPNPADPDGLGQQLAIRLYANTYMKAGWNRFGNETKRPEDHDFEETVGVNHTEVFANDAIFAVQEETFGTRDPYADRTMRPQYLCMTLDMATTIGDVDLEMEMEDIVPSENNTYDEGLEDHLDEHNESDVDEGDENVSIPVNGTVDFEEELCEDGGIYHDWVFGDQPTGELPEVPPASEMLQEGVDSTEVGKQEIELPVGVYANATYYEYKLDAAYDPVTYLEDESADMEDQIRRGGGQVDEDVSGDLPVESSDEYDGSPHDIRDELYQLDVELDQSASDGSLPSPDSPSGSGWSRISRSEDVTGASVDSVVHTPKPQGDDYDREIHEIAADATVQVEVEETYRRTVDNETQTTTRHASGGVDVDVETTIDAEYGFEAGGVYYESYEEFQVAQDPIETDHGSHEDVTFERGFENALVELTSAESYDTAERDIADELESDLESASPHSLDDTAEDSIREDTDASLGPDSVIPGQRTELSESLDDELQEVHREFTDDWEEDSFTIEVRDLSDDESPPERIKEHIQDNYEDEYVDDGPYETPEEMARQQMRKAYFDRLYYWLDRFDGEHSERMDDLNDKIDDQTDGAVGGLNEVLGFVQDLSNADYDPDPAELDGSPVHDEAHYEVSGAPTYLTATEVNRTQVSAVRASDETVLDTDTDADHDPLSIRTHNRVPWPGLAALFYIPDKWYITLNFWNVDVNGEYSRLEVSSTIGDPGDSDRLTYVAEDSPVDVELSDDSRVDVGRNEAVTFDTSTEIIVVMPGFVVKRGGPVPAVADGDFDPEGTVYCSETWEEVGPNADSVGC